MTKLLIAKIGFAPADAGPCIGQTAQTHGVHADGLPALTGVGDKQIAYGEAMRRKALIWAAEQRAGVAHRQQHEAGVKDDAAVYATVNAWLALVAERVAAVTSAKVWIEAGGDIRKACA